MSKPLTELKGPKDVIDKREKKKKEKPGRLVSKKIYYYHEVFCYMFIHQVLLFRGLR